MGVGGVCVWSCSVDQEEREGEKETLETFGLRTGCCNGKKCLRIRTGWYRCSVAMLMLLLIWGEWLVVVSGVLISILALLHSSRRGGEG